MSETKLEPKKRKWSVAIEADEDFDADIIFATLHSHPGIDVMNIEEVETSFTEETDDDDDVPK